MSKQVKPGGVCRLTLRMGTFVKSHIIPRALVNVRPGTHFIMIKGKDGRPIRRWNGWYDPALVIRAGENILSRLDAYGIEFLREQRLVWKSWHEEDSLPDAEVQTGPIDFREIAVDNSPKLRLFFLSLLWRAAATPLPEFECITLPEGDLEHLRLCLLEQKTPNPNFYPTTLVQYVTRSDDHIRAPFRSEMSTFTDNGEPTGSVPIFRFFFDGLSVLVRLPHSGSPEELGDLQIGNSERLLVQTMPFSMSRNVSELRHSHNVAVHHWPDEMARYHVLPTPFSELNQLVDVSVVCDCNNE